MKKTDLEEVLKDYPDAQRILNARAKKLMKENHARHHAVHAEEGKNNILFHARKTSTYDPKRDPALLDAVLRLLPRAKAASSFRSKHRSSNNAYGESRIPYSRSVSEDDMSAFTSKRRFNRNSVSQDEGLMKLSQNRQTASFSSNYSTPYSLMSSDDEHDNDDVISTNIQNYD